MSDTNVPVGWHPDPDDQAQLRWWDGHGWTSEVRPLATFPRALADPSWYSNEAQVPSSTPVFTNAGSAPPSPPIASTAQKTRKRRSGQPLGAADTFALRNQSSLTAVLVSAISIVVALTSTVFFVGVIPVIFTYRAIRQREALMPLAVVATAAVIAVTVARATHH